MSETPRSRDGGRNHAGHRDFWVRNLHALGIATSLVLLVLFFWAYLWFSRGENFLAPIKLKFMAVHWVAISLPALGMTIVIISGGIDLSVGSVIALSMCVTAWCIRAAEFSAPPGGAAADDLASWAAAPAGILALSALAGVATGTLAGLVNGLLITSFRLVPFIVTLGMMSVARGAAKLVGNNQEINVHLEGSWLEDLTLSGGLFFAPSVWILLFLAAIVAWTLRSTVFGRRVFAIGSNEEAARLCGVGVERSKILIYSLAGLFTGMAGVFYLSRLAQGSPTEAVGQELDVIAAVVIGGGSLNGGEGSVFGSLAGAFIMVVLRDGLYAIGAGNAVQDVLIGVIIIVAVLADQLQRRQGAIS